VLDLTDPDTCTQIGITKDELVADDWTVRFPDLLGGSPTEVELVV
jgi:hypothetical protein